MSLVDRVRSWLLGGSDGWSNLDRSPSTGLYTSPNGRSLPPTAMDRLRGASDSDARLLGGQVSLTDAAQLARSMVGGRLSRDDVSGTLSALRILAPPNAGDADWRVLAFDHRALDRLPAQKLLEILNNLSPDVSKANWDFLRFCNPGWEAKVFRPGGKTPFPRGQTALDQMLDSLNDLHGAFDVVISRLFMGPFLRGAFFAELVLDLDGKDFVDIATPDPGTARFERWVDPVRGPYWQLGQYQAGGFVPLDRSTIRYIPIDPQFSPYGRAMAAPALFTTLFLLGLLHDMRRVVSQQGYPRLDIMLSLEKLKETMPEDLAENPAKVKAWVDSAIVAVQNFYAHLSPDDAYVHTDAITLNRPVGTVDASSLAGLSPIIERLERQSVRALKTMPITFGITDGVSEANANRQWEIHVAGIKALQHLCETLLERLFGLALQAQGIPARVEFRFAELRSSEELRDQQTLQLKINNAKLAELSKYVTHDQAAMMVTGQPSPTKEEIKASNDAAGIKEIVPPKPAAPAQPAQPADTTKPVAASDGAKTDPAPGESKSTKSTGLRDIDSDTLSEQLGYPWYGGRRLVTRREEEPSPNGHALVGAGKD
jgi:hypothetical protein